MMEILGLSLTTWLVIFGVFAIITPVVGRQVAKDSLEIKNALSADHLRSFILFPRETLEGTEVRLFAPVQEWMQKKYIARMMMGGIWIKFLYNLAVFTFFTLVIGIGFILYSVGAFFRGIFSAK